MNALVQIVVEVIVSINIFIADVVAHGGGTKCINAETAI
jgi:hypothetical protein